MIDFTNFHDNTVAHFTPCEKPARKPDYESEWSTSVYWDTGTGVIRSSDHWSGNGSCGWIRSCYWTLKDAANCYETFTGHCSYADFRRPKSLPVWHMISQKDITAAKALSRGPVPASEWVDGYRSRARKKEVPVWAAEYSRTDSPDLLPRAVKKLFRRTGARKAIHAPAATTKKVLGGQKKMKVGTVLA